MKLDGRKAFVTGGGRGIGAGCSLALAEAGADVAVAYRRGAEAADETVQAIEKLGRKAVKVQCDVSQEEQVSAAVRSVLDTFGSIDILIANAGIASRGNSVHDTSTEEMRRVMDTHVMGSFWCCKEVIGSMRERGRGHIIMISSVATMHHGANGAPYNMAKAAMESLMHTLCKEEGPNGIRVNVIGPGKITGCGRAVTFFNGSDNVVRGLYLSGNLTGINLQGGADQTARNNVIVSNEGTAIATSGVVNARILDNWIVANGGDPNLARGFGITNDNASSATISRNHILGNFRGGIAEVGASALISEISRNIILGNGGFDLDLRDTDDTVEQTICETSNPAGLCPDPLPRFPFNKGKKR